MLSQLWLWFSLVIAGVLLIQFILNVLLLPRLKPATSPGPLPVVSVLVPARNEASRIGSCLESLAAQNYPSLEIIVLDDQSSDATAQIVRALGFSADPDSTRRLVLGASLPPGWTGKSWACHQLAQVARGDYLLFTDADTIYQPEAVSSTVAAAQQLHTDLLTLWPFQITVTLAEKLVVPLLFVVAGSYLPHWLLIWAQRAPWLARLVGPNFLALCATANGQFLLFRRESYFRLGGHQAVREHLVEDISLARAVAKRIPDGWRLASCDGTLLVHCRMYGSVAQMWEGFTKNLWPVFDGDVIGFWMAILWQFLVCVLPFLVLPFCPGLQLQVLVSILLILRAISAFRFKTSWLSVGLHPIGYGFALLIAINSFRRAKGKGITWKDRIYPDRLTTVEKDRYR